jgi:putative peptide zinc metalloprotease protein
LSDEKKGGSPFFRLRADLEWVRHEGQTAARPWVVRDPLSLEYFSFSELEHRAARLLDGSRSAGIVLGLLKPLDLAGSWTVDRVNALIMRLESCCLLQAGTPAGGQRLWQRKRGGDRRGWAAALLSPLAIRVPVFDPAPWLAGWFQGAVARVLFSGWLVAAVVLAAMTAALQVVPRLLDSSGQLTTTFRFFDGANAVWLVVAWIVLKSLHELGHLLACRRWGCECHEVGLWFLFFLPSLYCDTSDNWKMASRWRRAAVAAAGVHVELLVATLAAWAWLWMQPGLARDLAANLMVIGTVGTVLINGNPLMRYDGYYVLSDLWGVPNLAEQSREALRGSLTAWLTGQSLPRERWDAAPAGLVLYALAAWCWRMLVLVAILFAAWRFLEPMGLELVALALTVITVAGVVLGSASQAAGVAGDVLLGGGKGRFSRSALTLLLLALLVGAVGWVPLPSWVAARGYCTERQVTPLFAAEPGILAAVVADERRVEAGTVLVRIEAPERQLEQLELAARIRQLTERESQLRLLSVDEPQAELELESVVDRLAGLRSEAALLDAELAEMSVRAPRSGQFRPATAPRPAPLVENRGTPDGSGRLPRAEPGNAVTRGELLGWLADENSMEVRVLVPEHDAQRLRTDLPVSVRLDARPASKWQGKITRISPDPVGETPPALSGDAWLVSERNAEGRLVPLLPHYEVRVELDEAPAGWSSDGRVHVHIDTGSATLWQSLLRLARRHLLPLQ